jgi:hypothetical protein
MRASGWIMPQPKPGDRRRHVWQISQDGHGLLGQMLHDADRLRDFAEDARQCARTVGSAREAAA